MPQAKSTKSIFDLDYAEPKPPLPITPNIAPPLTILSHHTLVRVLDTFDPDSQAFYKDCLNGEYVVSLDAEWAKKNLNHPMYSGHRFLTKQFQYVKNGRKKCVVMWDREYPLPFGLAHKPSRQGVDIPNMPDDVDIFIILCDAEKDTPFTLGMLGDKSKIHLLMFYSPIDLEAFLGYEVVQGCYHGHDKNSPFRGELDKNRRLTLRLEWGNAFISVIDIIGTCTAGMGLDKFVQSVGVDNPYKSIANNWDKGDMQKYILECPDLFLQYALGDVLYLKSSLEARVSQVNLMVKDALGFDPGYLPPWHPNTSKRFRMTAGSLVNNSFLLWLEQDPRYNRALNILRNFTVYSNSKGQSQFQEILLKSPTVSDPVTGLPKKLKGDFETTLDVYHPLSYASIPSLVYHNKGFTSSGLLTAIVFGGRCLNENPTQHRIDDVLDIDLSSCYGTSLRGTTLPAGLPRVYKQNSFEDETKGLSLGTFLKLHRDELLDGLYTIYVSGKLSFEQDLIASKINVDAQKIEKALLIESEDADDSGKEDATRDVDKTHLPGDMVHLKSELVNAVITSDILKTILATGTDKEKASLMNCKVLTAMWYAKQDRFSDIDEFEVECSKHLPLTSSAGEPNYPKAWFPIDVGGFVGGFIDARKRYKKQSVRKGDDFDLLQNGVKLFINTVYGCLASPYFEMGNTILANNITAKARVGAWMMAKALRSVQSITDGGAYPFMVRFLKPELHRGSKPGLHILSDYNRLDDHRCVIVHKLTEDDFQDVKRDLWAGDCDDRERFEELVTRHINNFWGHYGLELPFNIEHKYENTCDTMIYTGSADYLMIGTQPGKTKLRNVNGKDEWIVFKSRGSKEYKGEAHVKEKVMRKMVGDGAYPDLIAWDDGVPLEIQGSQSGLIGVNDYKNHSKNKEMVVCGAMPGDEFLKTTYWMPNINHHLCKDESEWKERKRVQDSKVRKHKKEREAGSKKQFGIQKHKAVKNRGVFVHYFPEIYAQINFDNM